MDAAWQFLQTYGPLLALGGAVVFLMTRSGGGCCGMPQRGGAAASCHQTPAEKVEGAPVRHAATPAELRAQLAGLRGQQEEIARRVAALEAEAPRERMPVGQA